jgi:hypothetical protein
MSLPLVEDVGSVGQRRGDEVHDRPAQLHDALVVSLYWCAKLRVSEHVGRWPDVLPREEALVLHTHIVTRQVDACEEALFEVGQDIGLVDLGTKQLISAETGVFGEIEVLFDFFWKGEELGRRGPRRRCPL